MEVITFAECPRPGYVERTIENARADMTIAMAWDFTTAGEMLTKRVVESKHRIYVAVPLNNPMWLFEATEEVMLVIRKNKPKHINIAGNGIYTSPITQENIDEFVYTFLKGVFELAEFKPELIRSGGQTGIDEAGLKAAVKLGIKAYCLAPKGWVFRDKNRNDIRSEVQFKARFENLNRS